MSDNSQFERLGLWLWRLLLVYLALLVVESAAGLAVMAALSGSAEADLTAGQQMTTGYGLLTMGYSAYGQLAVFIVVAILFLRLLYKAAQRAKGFAAPFTYISPGWAVGYWFIPLINLYQPFRIVKALFAACAQEAGTPAKPAAGEQLLSAWWALFLISGIAERMLASSESDFNTRPGISSFAEYSIVCNLLTIVATLLFAAVIKRLVQALGSAGAVATVPAAAASVSHA
ncbi:MAG TPA: DUF4328 domain-containing protein [Gammaproteobacteria bacterium]|jgi:hypothetical protein